MRNCMYPTGRTWLRSGKKQHPSGKRVFHERASTSEGSSQLPQQLSWINQLYSLTGKQITHARSRPLGLTVIFALFSCAFLPLLCVSASSPPRLALQTARKRRLQLP